MHSRSSDAKTSDPSLADESQPQDPSSVLGHLQHRLIQQLAALGYPQHTEGICYGIALLGIQAILADDIETFTARLNTLSKINPNDLPKAIANAKEAEKQRMKEAKMLAERLKNTSKDEEPKDNHEKKKSESNETYQEMKVAVETVDEEKDQKSLSQEQSNLLSAQAFFDGVILSQSPIQFSYWIKKNTHDDFEISKEETKSGADHYSTSPRFFASNTKLTLPLTLPDKLMTESTLPFFTEAEQRIVEEATKKGEGKGKKEATYKKMIPGVVEVDMPHSGIYCFEELVGYFKKLRDALGNRESPFKKPVTFLLTSTTHAISIGWNPAKKEWIFIDANQLPPITMECKEASDKEMATRTIQAFFKRNHTTGSANTVPENTTTAFATRMYVEKSCLEQAEKFMRAMQPTLEEVTDKKAIAKDSGDASWLHIAAYLGQTEVVKKLLDEKANLDLTNKENCTPLHFAAYAGHAEIVKILIEKKADTYSLDKMFFAPVYHAATRGHIDILKMLLSEVADITKIPRYSSFTLLHAAALYGHRDIVKALIDKKATINSQEAEDETGTPLYCAAQGNHTDVMQLLLAQQANIDLAQKDGDTPLHIAARKGNAEAVRMLLKQKATLNSKDKRGVTPLHQAAQAGQTAVIQILHEEKAEIDLTDPEGNTPLHYAAYANQADAIKQLLAKNATIDFKTHAGYTPLHEVAEQGHTSVLEVLLEQKANIELTSKNGKTPLHYAAYAGQVNAAKVLLDKGAKVDSKNEEGYTPLHLAVEQGRTGIIEMLLEQKAELESTNKSGNTPLHCAVQAGQTSATKMLLDKRAKIDLKNEEGYTPLHLAVEQGRTDIIEMLLEQKAELESTNKSGNTPLHCAVQASQASATKMLLDKGAKTDLKNEEGYTPLHLAAEKSRTGIIEMLLEQKAELESTNKSGNTPLHCAVQTSQASATKMLLDKGAKTDLKNKEGYTPLHLAIEQDNTRVAEVLLEQKAKLEPIHLQDKNGNTSLHLAAKKGRTGILEMLLNDTLNLKELIHLQTTDKAKAVEILKSKLNIIHLQDINGNTPLHLAAQQGHTDIIKALLLEDIRWFEKEANETDIDVIDELLDEAEKRMVKPPNTLGATPLHYAVQAGQENAVEILLNNKVKIDYQDKKGNTPLHLAAQQGHTQIIRTLLSHSANIELTNNNDLSPFHIAEAAGHSKAANLLKPRETFRRRRRK